MLSRHARVSKKVYSTTDAFVTQRDCSIAVALIIRQALEISDSDNIPESATFSRQSGSHQL